MPLARCEFDATDVLGNLLDGTSVSVEVRRESGGMPQLYSDRDGTLALGNPFIVTDGKVAFHAAGGAYKITLTAGALTRERRYVAVGLAGETDFTLARNAGVWSALSTYSRGEYVVHDEVGVFISTVDGNLNNEPDSTTPGSTDDWTYYPGLAGPPGEPGIVGNWTGPWVTATGYNIDDIVEFGGSSYICLEAHTSGAFATDLAAGKWDLVVEKGDEGAPGTEGKFSGSEVIKTAAYTALAADVGKTIILNKATADTLSFDPAATLGATWMVMVKNIGAGTWTLDPSGAETIDGAATASLARLCRGHGQWHPQGDAAGAVCVGE